MYLYLGQDTVVPMREIVGIFDMDNTTQSKWTVRYLNMAEKEGRLINISDDIPKSFIICKDGDKETVYLSQLNPSTLLKRSTQSIYDMIG